MRTLKAFIAGLMVCAFLSFPSLAAHDGTCEKIEQTFETAAKEKAYPSYRTKDPMRIDMLPTFIEGAPTSEEVGEFTIIEIEGNPALGAVWYNKEGCLLGFTLIPEIIMQSVVGNEWRNVGGF